MTTTIERPTETPTEPPAKPRTRKAPAEQPEQPTRLACSVGQEHLHKALALAARFASGKPSIPALTNVHLAVREGRLHLTTTDLSTGLRTSVPLSTDAAAHPASEGAFTVPARFLAAFVATLPTQTVHLEDVGHVLKVTCGTVRAEFKGIDADEFPRVPEILDAEQFTLPVADLKRVIGLTTFAAATGIERPILCGVGLHSRDGTLTAGSTNAFRMSHLMIGLETPLPSFECVVPAPALDALAKLLTDGDVKIALLPDPTRPAQLLARTDVTTLAMRLLEGQFPDIERVIPKRDDAIAIMTVDRTALLACAKRAMLFNQAAAGMFSLRTDPDAQQLWITAQDAERGEGEAQIAATITGEATTVSIQGKYLQELLETLSGEQIELVIRGPLSPILLTDPSLPGFRHVIMPMHTVGR